MTILYKRRKLFCFLAAAMLFLAGLLTLLLGLGGIVATVVETIEDGFEGLVESILPLLLVGTLWIVPMAFAVFALLYGISEKNRKLLAVGAGIALLQLLAMHVLTMFISMGDLTSFFEEPLWSLENMLSSVNIDVFPFVLFGFALVFILKGTKTPAAPAVVAALAACLMINTMASLGRTLMIAVVEWGFAGMDFWGMLGSLVASCGTSLYSVLYYGGLLLVLPMAAGEAVPRKVLAEQPAERKDAQSPETVFAEEDDFAPEE